MREFLPVGAQERKRERLLWAIARACGLFQSRATARRMKCDTRLNAVNTSRERNRGRPRFSWHDDNVLFLNGRPRGDAIGTCIPASGALANAASAWPENSRGGHDAG